MFLLAPAQALATPVAAAPAAVHTVQYMGYALDVPASWPVFDLSLDPAQCVAYNTHAVFLGAPGAAQDCPAHAAGRTEAILIEPLASVTAGEAATASVAAPGRLIPAPVAASVGQVSYAVPGAGVFVTATWRLDAASVWAALGTSRLTSAARATPAAPASHQVPAARAPMAVAATAAPAVGTASFTGVGFDACAAPSTSTMAAWHISSPYSAVGVYIGGVNRSCAQPNLTPSWVTTQATAGWRLIPIYVGLQAPTNACGCSAIPTGDALNQGFAAADDAAAQARALGIAAGNAIYDDMEAYATGTSNTPFVLTFLEGWTSRLHDNGYLAGVYSSAASGIADLVSQYGTSYPEPDDLWIAHWNGQQTTADAYVPAADWGAHQRLHQYQGGHTESYGGVAINIDGDYLDGAAYPSGDVAEPAVAGVTMDAYGGVHHFGSVLSNTWGTQTWPGWSIARGVAVRSDHSGGYVVDGWGALHPFGTAPPLAGSAYWPGWDIARGLALSSDGLGGYVLDGWGGVHPFGNAPAVTVSNYWHGWDIAVGIVLRSDNRSGWVLDGWGGLHPFAVAGTPQPPAVAGPYWRGWKIARAVSLTGDGGGYILDGWGGVDAFGNAVPTGAMGYSPGSDIARAISMYSSSPVAGYWLDAYGGVHQVGAAAPAPAPVFLPGSQVFRGLLVTP